MTVPSLPLSSAPWPGEWHRSGRCRTLPTDVFFPTRGEDLEPARAICRACPVQDNCAEYAIGVTGLLGVWGGMSEKDRRQARNARKRSPQESDRRDTGRANLAGELPEPQPVAGAARPGSLLATLTELTAHPQAWAIVVHYHSRNSAWATASLLRTGKRRRPTGGIWQFEGRLSRDGGSDLWARYTPHPTPAAAELVDADETAPHTTPPGTEGSATPPGRRSPAGARPARITEAAS